MAISLDIPFPVLVLDAGVKEACALLALPGTPAESWPRTLFPVDQILSSAKAFFVLIIASNAIFPVSIVSPSMSLSLISSMYWIPPS